MGKEYHTNETFRNGIFQMQCLENGVDIVGMIELNNIY